MVAQIGTMNFGPSILKRKPRGSRLVLKALPPMPQINPLLMLCVLPPLSGANFISLGSRATRVSVFDRILFPGSSCSDRPNPGSSGHGARSQSGYDRASVSKDGCSRCFPRRIQGVCARDLSGVTRAWARGTLLHLVERMLSQCAADWGQA